MATKPKYRISQVGETAVPKAYLRLMEKFLLRYIEDEQHLAAATSLADDLFARPSLLPEEQ